MNELFLLKAQKKINIKTINLLSLVALVLSVLGAITHFVGYKFDAVHYTYEFGFKMPSLLGIIFFLLTVAPPILFFVYLTKYYRQVKAAIFIPIIFGMIALYQLFVILENVIYAYSFRFVDVIFIIPFFVFSCLAVYSSLKGMSKKIFVSIAMLIGILYELFSIINLFQAIDFYIEEGFYLYLFTWPIGILGTICFYVSLLLFALKSKIPSILTISPEKVAKSTEKLSPEQSLKILNDKLELGMITEEEYQIQRAEIISKL